MGTIFGVVNNSSYTSTNSAPQSSLRQQELKSTANLLKQFNSDYIRSFELDRPGPREISLDGVVVLNDRPIQMEGLSSGKMYTSEGSADFMTIALNIDDRKAFYSLYQGLENYFKVGNNESYIDGNEYLYKWAIGEDAKRITINGEPNLHGAADADLIIFSNLYQMAKRIEADKGANDTEKLQGRKYLVRAKELASSIVKNYFVQKEDGYTYLAPSTPERNTGVARVDYWNIKAYDDLLEVLGSDSNEGKIVQKAIDDFDEIVSDILDNFYVFPEKIKIEGKKIIPLSDMNYEVRLPYRVANVLFDRVEKNNFTEKDIPLFELAFKLLDIRGTNAVNQNQLLSIMKSTLAAVLLKVSDTKNNIKIPKKVADMFTKVKVDKLNEMQYSPTSVKNDDLGYYGKNLQLQASTFNLMVNGQLNEGLKMGCSSKGEYYKFPTSGSFIADITPDAKPIEEKGFFGRAYDRVSEAYFGPSVKSITEPQQFFSRSQRAVLEQRYFNEERGSIPSLELAKMANSAFAYGNFYSAMNEYFDFLYFVDLDTSLAFDSKSVIEKYVLHNPEPNTAYLFRAVDSLRICMESNAVSQEEQIGMLELILYRKNKFVDENKSLAEEVMLSKDDLRPMTNKQATKLLTTILEPYFRPRLSSTMPYVEYSDQKDKMNIIIEKLLKLDWNKIENDVVYNIFTEVNNRKGNIALYSYLADLYIKTGRPKEAYDLIISAFFDKDGKDNGMLNKADSQYLLTNLSSATEVLSNWASKYGNHPFYVRIYLDLLKVFSVAMILGNQTELIGDNLEKVTGISSDYFTPKDGAVYGIREYALEDGKIRKEEVNVTQKLEEFLKILTKASEKMDLKEVQSELVGNYAEVVLEHALQNNSKEGVALAIKYYVEALKLEKANLNRTVILDKFLKGVVKSYSNAYDIGIEKLDGSVPAYKEMFDSIWDANKGASLIGDLMEEVGKRDTDLKVGLELNMKLYSAYLYLNIARNTKGPDGKISEEGKAMLENLSLKIASLESYSKEIKGLGEYEVLRVRFSLIETNILIALGDFKKAFNLMQTLSDSKVDIPVGAISTFDFPVSNDKGGISGVNFTVTNDTNKDVQVVFSMYSDPAGKEIKNYIQIINYNKGVPKIIELSVNGLANIRVENNKLMLKSYDNSDVLEIDISNCQEGKYYVVKDNKIEEDSNQFTAKIVLLRDKSFDKYSKLKGLVTLEDVYTSNPALYGEVMKEYSMLCMWDEVVDALGKGHKDFVTMYLSNLTKSANSIFDSSMESVMSILDIETKGVNRNNAENWLAKAEKLYANNFYYLNEVRLNVMKLRIENMKYTTGQKNEIHLPQLKEVVAKMKESIELMHNPLSYSEMDVFFDYMVSLREYVLSLEFNDGKKAGTLSEEVKADLAAIDSFFSSLFLGKKEEDMQIAGSNEVKDLLKSLDGQARQVFNDVYLKRKLITGGLEYFRYLTATTEIDKAFRYKVDVKVEDLIIKYGLNLDKSKLDIQQYFNEAKKANELEKEVVGGGNNE